MIIYGESDKVLIREMQEADYEIYYGMNQISLEIKDTLDEEQIKKIWRNIVDKEFTCVIIEKRNISDMRILLSSKTEYFYARNRNGYI